MARFKNFLSRLLDGEFAKRIGAIDDSLIQPPQPGAPPIDPEADPIFWPQVRWHDVWTQKTYFTHDMVRDGEWTMIANKETSDRPSPQPTGPSEWLSELPDAPLWQSDSDNATIVFTGQRYTFVAGFLTGMRVWIPVADGVQEYAVWLEQDPEGSNPIFTNLLPIEVADSVGWKEVGIPVSLIATDTVWDLYLVAYSAAAPGVVSAPWNYIRSNSDPLDGQITHDNDNTTMRISYTDSNLGDQTSLIQGLSTGDLVDNDVGGVVWTIVRIISQELTFGVFEVGPAVRDTNGLYTFNFTILIAGAVPSVSIPDYYLAPPPAAANGIDGRKGIDDFDNVVSNDNAYGVDIKFTPAIVSDDWDLVALSEGVASANLPEDVKFFHDVSDINIATQADDPTTPTNWVTYHEFEMTMEQEVNYEYHLRRVWSLDVANREAYFRTLLNDVEVNPGEFNRIQLAIADNREYSVDISVSDLTIVNGAPLPINIKLQALVSAGGNPILTIYDTYFLIRSLPSAVEVF